MGVGRLLCRLRLGTEPTGTCPDWESRQLPFGAQDGTRPLGLGRATVLTQSPSFSVVNSCDDVFPVPTSRVAAQPAVPKSL